MSGLRDAVFFSHEPAASFVLEVEYSGPQFKRLVYQPHRPHGCRGVGHHASPFGGFELGERDDAETGFHFESVGRRLLDEVTNPLLDGMVNQVREFRIVFEQVEGLIYRSRRFERRLPVSRPEEEMARGG